MAESAAPPAARHQPVPGAGERKTVTVLFADIVDSTRLIAELDPEAADSRLQPVLDAMQSAVHRYAGTVNKVQGDGIMALFGAPIALEDHAVMACYAALAMRAAAEGMGEAGTHIRVGLNSGDVVVRTVGNDISIDYDAIGPTVHLAARMEQMAPPGTILMTEMTHRLAAGQIRARDCGPTAVKGVADRVRVYELESDRGVLTRWAVRASRGVSPLIGREHDMDVLLHARGRVLAGQGQVVGISGHAGIGKSRLLHELIRKHATASEWQVLQFDAVPYADSISYHPISNFLRAWLGIAPEDSQDAIRQRLNARVGRLVADIPDVLPSIQTLLDVPVRDESWTALDPPQRRHRIIESLRLLILARAERTPVLLIFEDLHWMDSETIAVLDSIVHAIVGARVLAVLTHRPGFSHGWEEKSYYRAVNMQPLGADAVTDLLDHLIGHAPGNIPLKQLLGNLSHGTPLFLEEMARVLVEDGTLRGRRGAYELTRDVTEVRIPDSVQAIISARIDNLSRDHKSLLQVAAVIGKTFPFALLEDVADLPRDRLLEGITQLQASEFVYATRLIPSAEYSFKHALTQEVAYKGALRDRRRGLHRRVMQAIEERFRDRPDEVIESLAHHAVNAEAWEKAFEYLGRAGHKALERSAYREAANHFEAALRAVEHLPPSEAARRRTIQLRLGLRAAFGPIGELGRMYDHLRDAEREARALGDDRLVAAVKTAQTFVFTLNGDLDDAIAAGEAAVSIPDGSGGRELATTAGVFLGQALQFRGDFPSAARVLVPARDYLRGEARYRRLGTTSTTSVLTFYILASVFASMGRFDDALRAARESLEIAGHDRRPYDLSLAHGGVGAVHFRRGDHAEALAAFERGREVCVSGDIRSMFPWLSAQAGSACAMIGQHTRAREYLSEARRKSENMKLVYYHAWAIAFSGAAALRAGDEAGAADHLANALALAEKHGYWAVEVWCLRHLGELEATQGGPARREELLRRALVVAERGGMRPESALIHHMLAGLMEAAREPRAAAEEAARAEALFRSLGIDPPAAEGPQQGRGAA